MSESIKNLLVVASATEDIGFDNPTFRCRPTRPYASCGASHLYRFRDKARGTTLFSNICRIVSSKKDHFRLYDDTFFVKKVLGNCKRNLEISGFLQFRNFR